MSRKTKPVITIGTPHRRDFMPEYVASLAVTLTAGLPFSFVFRPQAGRFVFEQRNDIARNMVGDHLLFIDSDMAWQPEDVSALVAVGKDIVGGLYLLAVFEQEGDVIRLMGNIPGEPFQCAAIGTGFLLINRHVIETMLAPEFVRENGLPFDPLKEGWGSDDISFCLRAKKAGFQVWCHPEVKLGHVKHFTFWPDISQDGWRFTTTPPNSA